MKIVYKTRCIALFSGIACFFIVAAGAETHQRSIQAGFAEEDISPATGMEMPGNYGKVFHDSFHDPCKVRAAVFDDGTRKIALVGVDALMVPRHLVLEARKQIQAQCGIAPESIMIGASHSHSSGPTGMVQPGEFDFASPLVQSLAYEKSSCANADYLHRVQKAIVDAVCKAAAKETPALYGVGKGSEDQVSFNRRFTMKNGQVFTHPGKGNPDIVSVAGPIDPEVGVIGVWDKNQKLLGCVVNFACHATTNPGGISANWIYYMERAIRGALGEDAIVVFMQGFCGDVTQVNNLSPYSERSGEDSPRFVGGRVGAEAVKILVGMAKGTSAELNAQSEIITCDYRIPDPDRVKRCEEIVKKPIEEVGHTAWIFAKEIVLLDAMLSQNKKSEVEIQALQIGPAIFLSAPGEMFCQLGLDIKRRSVFSYAFPVELANGCVGYVPTPEALGERGGGYETRLTSYTNLEPEAGTKMVDAALKLANGMKPGKEPFLLPAPEFKEPWSYGNVPPELK